MLKEIPDGLEEIIATYGPLTEMASKLTTFDLPYPLLYAPSPYESVICHKATCHKLLVDNFVGALAAIKAAQLEQLVLRYGGLYANRVKRGQSHPSVHAWGAAIDLEPQRYPLGSDARFPDAVIEIFRKFGFFYGGDFHGRKDPMHFQAVVGY